MGYLASKPALLSSLRDRVNCDTARAFQAGLSIYILVCLLVSAASSVVGRPFYRFIRGLGHWERPASREREGERGGGGGRGGEAGVRGGRERPRREGGGTDKGEGGGGRTEGRGARREPSPWISQHWMVGGFFPTLQRRKWTKAQQMAFRAAPTSFPFVTFLIYTWPSSTCAHTHFQKMIVYIQQNTLMHYSHQSKSIDLCMFSQHKFL